MKRAARAVMLAALAYLLIRIGCAEPAAPYGSIAVQEPDGSWRTGLTREEAERWNITQAR